MIYQALLCGCSSMDNEWPFDQSPDCAVVSLRQIVFDGAPILHVTHDADDHGWQFLTHDDVREEDATVVGLGKIVKLDPSVLGVADIPPGWHARRQSADHEWIREPHN